MERGTWEPLPTEWLQQVFEEVPCSTFHDCLDNERLLLAMWLTGTILILPVSVTDFKISALCPTTKDPAEVFMFLISAKRRKMGLSVFKMT